MGKNKKLNKAQKQILSDSYKEIETIIRDYRKDGSFVPYTPIEVIERYTELEGIISGLNPNLWKELR